MRAIMHGKTSMIHHDNSGVFAGLPSPFEATRYHSLVIEQEALPDCLEVTAWTREQGGSTKSWACATRRWRSKACSFIPESILTGCGHDLLRNFLEQ